MTMIELPDGSHATVDQRDRTILVGRVAGYKVVWGQAFDRSARNDETTHGPFAFAFDVVDRMAADPAAFDRPWAR